MSVRYKVIGPKGWWRYAAYKRGILGFWWELTKSDNLFTIEETIKMDAATAYFYDDNGQRIKPQEATSEPNLI